MSTGKNKEEEERRTGSHDGAAVPNGPLCRHLNVGGCITQC
jgi:hypothetical protein